MNPSQLTTLLTDRALGELEPEVAALLDEYLSRNVEAVQQAASWRETASRLKEALTLPSDPSPLHYDQSLFGSVVTSERPRSPLDRILRLVACVAGGLIAGWMLHPQPKTSPLPLSARSHDAATFWTIPTARESAFRQEGRGVWGGPPVAGDKDPAIQD